jgi:hypothetical protein
VDSLFLKDFNGFLTTLSKIDNDAPIGIEIRAFPTAKRISYHTNFSGPSNLCDWHAFGMASKSRCGISIDAFENWTQTEMRDSLLF